MIIYIPIEVYNREVGSKLQFARSLAIAGHTVVLGKDSNLTHFCSSNISPAGVFLDKSASLFHFNMNFKNMHGKHILFVHDEEGPHYIDNKRFYNRLWDQSISVLSGMLCWGETDAAGYSKLRSLPSKKAFISGSMRFEAPLERARIYGSKVEAIRSLFGDFILYNSNCVSLDDLKIAYRNIVNSREARDPQEAEDVRNRFLLRENEIELEQKIINSLSQSYKDQSIIYRKHPGSSRYVLKHVPHNVHVVSGGSVEAWILAASKVIAYDCTTLLQAEAFEKEWINIGPDFHHLPPRHGLVRDLCDNQFFGVEKYIKNFYTDHFLEAALSAFKSAAAAREFDDVPSAKAFSELRNTLFDDNHKFSVQHSHEFLRLVRETNCSPELDVSVYGSTVVFSPQR